MTSFQVLPCTQEEKRTKHFCVDGLACSAFALISTKDSKNKQRFLKLWFPAQAPAPPKVVAPQAAWTTVLYVGLRDACRALFFSLSKKEFKLMSLFIMIENFVSLVQFTAKISQ